MRIWRRAETVETRDDRRTRPDRRAIGVSATRRVVRGRLGALSVRTAMVAGGWIGFALGLAIGAVMGAILCWFADAVLQWQRDLGFTLGVAQNLLPLGDQVSMLKTISREWYIVIPLAAFVGGAIWALIGGLVAGLVAAGYNHASRRITVVVEFAEPEPEAADLAGERHGEPRESLPVGLNEPLAFMPRRRLPVDAGHGDADAGERGAREADASGASDEGDRDEPRRDADAG